MIRSAMDLVISLLLVAAQIPSQSTVSGRIAVPSEGTFVSVARVQLQRLGQTIQEQVSFDGTFQFRNVAPGPYAVVVQAPGYEIRTVSADIPIDWEILVELQPIKREVAGGSGSLTVSVAEYHYARAVAQFEKARFEDARKLAHEAHEHRNHPADVHLLLAKIYLQLGEEGSVIPQLRLYIAESKPNPVRKRIEELLR